MKRLFQVVAWLVLVGLAGSANAQQSQHTGYWKLYAPTGEEYKCQIVSSRQGMERVLTRAGWNTELQRFPPIIWGRDKAIIIAPTKNHTEDTVMVFTGLFLRGSEITLNYEWRPRPPSVTHRTLSDGTQVTTSGSVSPVEPSVSVVSFNKNLDNRPQIYCSWRRR